MGIGRRWASSNSSRWLQRRETDSTLAVQACNKGKRRTPQILDHQRARETAAGATNMCPNPPALALTLARRQLLGRAARADGVVDDVRSGEDETANTGEDQSKWMDVGGGRVSLAG